MLVHCWSLFSPKPSQRWQHVSLIISISSSMPSTGGNTRRGPKWLWEREKVQNGRPAWQSCPGINWRTISLYLPASHNLAPLASLPLIGWMCSHSALSVSQFDDSFNFFLSVQHHFSPMSSFSSLLSNLMFLQPTLFPFFSFLLWIRQPIRHDMRPQGIVGIRVYWGSQSER